MFPIGNIEFYNVNSLRKYAFWGSTFALILCAIINLVLLEKFKNKYTLILPFILLIANIIIYIILLTEKKKF